jgi:hypothetical protein
LRLYAVEKRREDRGKGGRSGILIVREEQFSDVEGREAVDLEGARLI